MSTKPEHWLDHLDAIDIIKIDVGERILQPTKARIDVMAQSLENIGCINPIQLTRVGGHRWQLVTGATRLAAAKQLGWHQIKATAVGADNPYELKLLEIEENLVRSDLTEAERTHLEGIRRTLRPQRLAFFEDLIKNPHPAATTTETRRHIATGKPKTGRKGRASAAARKAGIPERTGRRRAAATSGHGRNKPNDPKGPRGGNLRMIKCPYCHGTGRVRGVRP